MLTKDCLHLSVSSLRKKPNLPWTVFKALHLSSKALYSISIGRWKKAIVKNIYKDNLNIMSMKLIFILRISKKELQSKIWRKFLNNLVKSNPVWSRLRQTQQSLPNLLLWISLVRPKPNAYLSELLQTKKSKIFMRVKEYTLTYLCLEMSMKPILEIARLRFLSIKTCRKYLVKKPTNYRCFNNFYR